MTVRFSSILKKHWLWIAAAIILLSMMALVFLLTQSTTSAQEIEQQCLFWVVEDDNKIIKRSITGAASGTTTLASTSDNVKQPRHIIVNNGFVYWTNYGSSTGAIRRVAADGSGSVTTIVSGQTEAYNISGLAVDSTNVYWSAQSNNRISSRKKDGTGAITIMASGTVHAHNPYDITIDDQYIYWASYSNHKISRKLKDNSGSLEIIAQGPNERVRMPTTLTVDGDYVYWINASSYPYIYRQLKNGNGTYEQISLSTESTANTAYMQVHGAYVYWSRSSGSVGMYRRPKDGTGAFSTISTDRNDANNVWGFTVHGDTVYWTNRSNNSIGQNRADAIGDAATYYADTADTTDDPVDIKAATCNGDTALPNRNSSSDNPEPIVATLPPTLILGASYTFDITAANTSPSRYNGYSIGNLDTDDNWIRPIRPGDLASCNTGSDSASADTHDFRPARRKTSPESKFRFVVCDIPDEATGTLTFYGGATAGAKEPNNYRSSTTQNFAILIPIATPDQYTPIAIQENNFYHIRIKEQWTPDDGIDKYPGSDLKSHYKAIAYTNRERLTQSATTDDGYFNLYRSGTRNGPIPGCSTTQITTIIYEVDTGYALSCFVLNISPANTDDAFYMSVAIDPDWTYSEDLIVVAAPNIQIKSREELAPTPTADPNRFYQYQEGESFVPTRVLPGYSGPTPTLDPFRQGTPDPALRIERPWQPTRIPVPSPIPHAILTPVPAGYNEIIFSPDAPPIQAGIIEDVNSDGTYNIRIEFDVVSQVNRYEIWIDEPNEDNDERYITTRPVNDLYSGIFHFTTQSNEGHAVFKVRGAFECDDQQLQERSACRLAVDGEEYYVPRGEKEYTAWSRDFWMALRTVDVPQFRTGAGVDPDQVGRDPHTTELQEEIGGLAASILGIETTEQRNITITIWAAVCLAAAAWAYHTAWRKSTLESGWSPAGAAMAMFVLIITWSILGYVFFDLKAGTAILPVAFILFIAAQRTWNTLRN